MLALKRNDFLTDMNYTKLIDVQFDQGNGVRFRVLYKSELIRCFIFQNNEFFVKRADGEDFIRGVQRYEQLIHMAALENIRLNGVSDDPWGNLITSVDIESMHADFAANQDALRLPS